MGNAFKLNNGLLLLSTEAPGGVYNSTQLKKIAALADGDTAVIKATEDQRLALFVKESAVTKVTSELQAVGLGVRHYQDGLHQPVNCLGELCPQFAQDAMGTSMDLAQELKKTQLGSPLKIGINGCGRCCVATHTLDISIVGDTNGYRISLGGKNSQIPEMASFMAEGVPAAKLPKLVAKVIALYKELAQTDESLQEVMERCGSKQFIEALHPYSQDAAGSDDPFGGMNAEPSQEDLKIEELPAPDDFGDVKADVGPAVGDDLGDLDEIGAGPNFDDVGPATSEELGLAEDDGLMLEATPAPETMQDDVPIGELSMDDEAVAMPTEELVMEEPATEELAMEELATEELAMEELATEELAMEEPATEELAMEELATEELAMEELATEEAVAPAADTEELTMEDLPAEGLAADGLGMEELSMEEPVVDEMMTTEELESDELVAEELESTDSLTEELDDSALAAAASAGDLDFDATEVTTAPAAPEPVMQEATLAEGDEEFANDMVADEVGEDEADAFEAKLNESIAEEESMPEIEDINAGDRMEAMRLIEANAELPSVGAVHESLNTDGSFDNLEIDHEIEHEVMTDGESEDTFAAAPEEPSQSSSASGFELTGVDVTADGRVALSFASGANVSIDPRSLKGDARKDLVMGGKKISLKSGSKGINVEVDGVAIFLPRRAA